MKKLFLFMFAFIAFFTFSSSAILSKDYTINTNLETKQVNSEEWEFYSCVTAYIAKNSCSEYQLYRHSEYGTFALKRNGKYYSVSDNYYYGKEGDWRESYKLEANGLYFNA